ncbi:MAG: hypothetical protein ABEJ92_08160 [Halobacteriales archaeon]
MVGLAPMPLIDDFLLDYHVGHAALLLFVLTVPAGLVKGSRKLVGLVFIAFGGLFLAVPSIDAEAGLAYALFGVALMVVGPVLYTTAAR